MNYPTFTVTVTREDNLWVAVVTDGLPQGVVAADDYEHFSDIRNGIAEIIADLTGIEPEQFNIQWVYDFGDDQDTVLVTEYFEAERIAREMAEWHDSVRSRLIAQLNGRLSQRAIADLLGLSHQRVHQIAHEAAGENSIAFDFCRLPMVVYWGPRHFNRALPRIPLEELAERAQEFMESLGDIACKRGEPITSVADEALEYLQKHS